MSCGRREKRKQGFPFCQSRQRSVSFLFFFCLSLVSKKTEKEKTSTDHVSVSQETAAPIQKFFFGSFQTPVNKVWNGKSLRQREPTCANKVHDTNVCATHSLCRCWSLKRWQCGFRFSRLREVCFKQSYLISEIIRVDWRVTVYVSLFLSCAATIFFTLLSSHYQNWIERNSSF